MGEGSRIWGSDWKGSKRKEAQSRVILGKLWFFSISYKNLRIDRGRKEATFPSLEYSSQYLKEEGRRTTRIGVQDSIKGKHSLHPTSFPFIRLSPRPCIGSEGAKGQRMIEECKRRRRLRSWEELSSTYGKRKICRSSSCYRSVFPRSGWSVSWSGK